MNKLITPKPWKIIDPEDKPYLLEIETTGTTYSVWRIAGKDGRPIGFIQRYADAQAIVEMFVERGQQLA